MLFSCYDPEIELLDRATVAEAKSLLRQGKGSYVYVGAGLTDREPPTTVIAYEKLEVHEGGAHVLYADGTVRWLAREQAKSLIQSLAGGAGSGRRVPRMHTRPAETQVRQPGEE